MNERHYILIHIAVCFLYCFSNSSSCGLLLLSRSFEKPLIISLWWIVVNYDVSELQKPNTTCSSTMLIGPKLDTDDSANMPALLWSRQKDVPWQTQLKVFKFESKEGLVERIVKDCELIAKSISKKERDLKKVDGMKVTLTTGGRSDSSSFGQSELR